MRNNRNNRNNDRNSARRRRYRRLVRLARAPRRSPSPEVPPRTPSPDINRPAQAVREDEAELAHRHAVQQRVIAIREYQRELAVLRDRLNERLRAIRAAEALINVEALDLDDDVVDLVRTPTPPAARP